MSIVKAMNEKPFRAKQLYEWIHRKRVFDIDGMTNLPMEMREKLKEEYITDPIKLEFKQVSDDKNAEKYIFSLQDGDCIECVWMRYKSGDSLCVSSQVGCRMGCTFCASTINGLSRNLTPGEILSQVYDVEAEHYGESGGRLSHIIVMGMGEPFDNYANLMSFIRILTSEKGRNLSARAISVSTCGLEYGIRKLADERLPITLALSLHAPDDELRNKIMPITASHPLSEVLDACREYFSKTGRRITWEYSMIQGVNDHAKHAEKLAELAVDMREKGCPVHINLIPLNPVKERVYGRSGEKTIVIFKKILEKYGINVTIRREMGSGIDAACGQLRRKVIG
ncbi:MAG: 23S rRNA (adenine(2503)-C(2))-methyltransferase RlmN [Eubacterium sp.]|nr:23S rRNA (adenine(2503)-C(2))-methyltransferase RlmN [Eubacterium sp.]